VLALIQTLTGLAVGGIAGIMLRLAIHWPEAPAILATAGCVGQAVRVALAYVGRPSVETHGYQLRIHTPAVIASVCIGLLATWTLLQFPATVVVPAASYLIVRALLSWELRRSGSLSLLGLQLAARGGELVTLLAAIIKN
jgi:hypothetical protein